MLLVGFIIRIYHNAWSPELQIQTNIYHKKRNKEKYYCVVRNLCVTISMCIYRTIIKFSEICVAQQARGSSVCVVNVPAFEVYLSSNVLTLCGPNNITVNGNPHLFLLKKNNIDITL